ncbi:hypothetical protein EDB84DRAFT_1514989 [Lactarius hengduanensis]|nr:hypothetical protein EDB84DRAFT_1514989 [Lactarius hengduanensis]
MQGFNSPWVFCIVVLGTSPLAQRSGPLRLLICLYSATSYHLYHVGLHGVSRGSPITFSLPLIRVVMLDLPATALRDASGPQSRVNALGPGIVGLFVQGIEIGMVFSQLATWMSLPGRSERRFITVLTVFITTVGFVQTAIYFLSIWRIYVEHYGEPLVPAWTERVHIILTVLISIPVQSLLIWRCYYILKRNAYLIIPLLLLLLGSAVVAIFDTIDLLLPGSGVGQSSNAPVFWPLLLYCAFTSILDIILSSILFYYLTQSRKRIYVDHTVQWISRHIIIVWQSVIPPTVCTLGISILYGVSQHLSPGPGLMWYPTLQAVIGKLYVLSHFYNINSRTQFVGEQDQPSTYISALTVPALHGMSTTINAPEERPLELYSDSFGRTDGRKGIMVRN